MDKISKALKLLSQKERRRVKEILGKIAKGDLEGLDVKKLKGRSDIFRVRKADIRIIYRQTKKDVFVLTIERRSERTYKRY